MNTYEKNLETAGVVLPDAPAPAANYIPFVNVDGMIYISGQISQNAEGFVCGKLGADYSVEQGRAAARLCAINLVAQLKAACGGDLSRLVRTVKLTGYVNATPDFDQHPAVMNGASDFIAEIFGTAGKHARVAVGCVSLPLGVAVEVDGLFQIRNDG